MTEDEITDTELLLNEAAGRAWLEMIKRRAEVYAKCNRQRRSFETFIYAFFLILIAMICVLLTMIFLAKIKEVSHPLNWRPQVHHLVR